MCWHLFLGWLLKFENRMRVYLKEITWKCVEGSVKSGRFPEPLSNKQPILINSHLFNVLVYLKISFR